MGKNTKLTIKYAERPLNTPNDLKILNGRKTHRNIPFQGLQK
jgi:hypothetical protein